VNSSVIQIACLTLLLATAGNAGASDFSPIHGFWSIAKENCKGTDIYWQIKASGASRIEELCEVVSATRKGDRFTLKQQCAVEGTESRRTDTFKLLSSGQLENGRIRYKRCPDPFNGGT
jgi:hypothetical protein